MGNSNSGGIAVVTDKTLYSPGELVSGTVYINTLQSVKANSVTLCVSGKEKSHWTESRSNGKSGTSTKHFNGTCRIFDNEVLLAQLDPNTGYFGQYQYPFSFVLPSNLPGSCDFLLDNVSASITYKVDVRINVVGMLKSDMKYKHVFYVRQVPLLLHRMQSSYSGIVTIFCCLSKGPTRIQMSADKSTYYPGDQVKVAASVDNQSRRNFRRIVLELEQILEVEACGRRKRVVSILATQVYPGIGRMRSDSSLNLLIAIPPMLPQMFNGYIVKMHYALRVRADIAMGRDPWCQIPLMVWDPNSTIGNVVTEMRAPPGYAPMSAPPVSFALTLNKVDPPQFPFEQYPNLVQLDEGEAADFSVQPSAPTFVISRPVISANNEANDLIRIN